MAKTSIHLKLEADLHARLAQMAKADRRSVSNFVEKLLHEHPTLVAAPHKINGHAHKTAVKVTAP